VAAIGLTLDTYSHVDLDMQAAAVRQVAAQPALQLRPECPVSSCDHLVTTGARNAADGVPASL
jgi:hypothetical protein